MTDTQLVHLQNQVVVERAKKGDYLFREGDTDHHNIYLLSGAVALLSGRKEMDVVTSGTETARFALAHQMPRKSSARAKCPVSFVRIDSRVLSDLLARHQSASYEVSETGDSSKGDWMEQLIQSPIFQQMPPANLQRVMMSMNEMPVSAEEVIIREGDEGDYFYLISAGQCRVTRQSRPDQPPVELTVLSAGQGFGEEALLSDKPRSSTVTMLTDGELVRLSKQDFVELVKRPVSNHIDYNQACQMVQENALWIDIRTPEEYETAHLPTAINLPYFSLRFHSPNLEEDHVYLIYGDDAGQTATAAYLLMERGYEVLVVKQEWQEIANQESESVQLQDEARELSPIQSEVDEVESLSSDSQSDQKQQPTDTTEALSAQLRQYQNEQKLLKQALAEAKHKLKSVEQETSKRQNAQAQELTQLSEKLAAAEVRHKDLKESEHKFKSQLKESQVKRNQLENELKQARANTAQAQEVQARYEQAGQQAVESRTILERQLTDLQQQHASLKAQFETLQTSKQVEDTRYQEEVKKLQSELEEAAHRSKQADAELDRIRQSSDATRDEYQQQLADAEEHREQQTQELTTLREKYELTRQESAALAQEHGELLQAREEMLGRIAALEKQKAEAIAEHEQQRQNLEQTLDTANTEAKTVREALAASQQELKAVEEQRAKLQIQFEQEHQTAEFLRRSLETAENAVEISDGLVEENNREITGLNQQLRELQSELAGVQADKSETEKGYQDRVQELQEELDRRQQELARLVAERQEEREQLQNEKANLETELAQTQATLQANQSSYDATAAEQQQRIDQLEHELQEAHRDSERAIQAQAELQEQGVALQQAQQEIERLTKVVDGLREVQLEMESQLSDDSEVELERLRGALEKEEKKRRHAEELAKQADVLRRERAVQETAVEMLGEDIENLTRENTRLTEERRLLEQEILELRSVTETHVAQLQGDETLDANTEIQALRTELEEVRKRAEEDLSQLRRQLTVADTKVRQQDERDVDTVATVQALRQEIDSIYRALSDKEQILRKSQSQCRSLEDAIEDRDREVDHLQRKLETLLHKSSGVA
ncbi:MAG: cyclic nucleotide-binding domain-containing protein [Chromatiales bacterium]